MRLPFTKYQSPLELKVLYNFVKQVIFNQAASYILEAYNFIRIYLPKLSYKEIFKSFKKLPCRTHAGEPLWRNPFVIRLQGLELYRKEAFTKEIFL